MTGFRSLSAEGGCRMGPALLIFFGALVGSRAAELAAVEKDYLAGNYRAVVTASAAAQKETPAEPAWTLLLVKGLLVQGRNSEAERVIHEALARDAASVRLRWAGREVALANGQPDEAKARVDEIRRLIGSRGWLYRNPTDLVILARAALLLGTDPKDVLDKVLTVAQKMDPTQREVYLARGEIALDKHDFALAAKAFEEGLKQVPDDPDLLCGRARAYLNSDREIVQGALEAALKKNPRHLPSLLLSADQHIDAEEYAEAARLLDQVIAVNPTQPAAWAYRAVLAHLRNDPEGESRARASALSTWARNPQVDYLIGEKLAQKYRFAEAADYERKARQFDPTFLPAAEELAQDLLRLGEEAEGWNLAQAVHERDDYDVEAYNLITLHDTMAKYAGLTGDDFVIRMAPQEVAVYGPRVLELLRRAKKTLTEKYGVELATPTYVEIFADPKDFAVRTFGLPDIPGFLGVCFGRVVTANSPASSTSPTNWESVLWHEFCHVVTLQLTKNKMPRWLSEGISVYEERQADPAWGMRVNPSYREMILGGDLVPVGKLSAAFLAPKSSRHLQFAYLESSLVVEFLVEHFGRDALRGILRDLRDGLDINHALEKNTVALATLEKEFAAYAAQSAAQLAPGLNWEKPAPDLLQPENAAALTAWGNLHPDNYWLLRYRAARAAEEQRWPDARQALERLVAQYPRQKGADTAYRPLVAAWRALGDGAAERRTLEKWVEVDDEAPDAYLRLLELAAADKDWPMVTRTVERFLAVNPLVAPPYRYLAQASAATKNDSDAVIAWRTLLQLDPGDPSDAHFQLAQILHRRGDDAEARRHVLFALEETPRYRDALRLLRNLPRAEGDTARPPEASELPASPVPTPPAQK